MIVIIHRGAHEIGGSCVEVRSGNTRIIVDLGLPLVAPWDQNLKLESADINNKSHQELLEIGILPRIAGLYESDGGERGVDAVLISHAHQDHFGLLKHIRRDIPVYLSYGTQQMIEANNIFMYSRTYLKIKKIVADSEPVTIGDFKITPYLMDHSAYDAMSFLIEAEGKKLFYSGDFRGHGRKGKLLNKMERVRPGPVDCLLMEGTTLGRNGNGLADEVQVESRIKKISGLYKGLKLFTTSVQNIDRMVSFYKAAASSGCSLVLDLYAAYVLWSLDKQTLPQASKDWEKVRVLFTDRYVSRLKSTRNDRMIASCENNKITQAEIKAKPGQFMLLYRQSSINDIEQIGDFKDSVLIYSMWDGYRREPSFQKTQNFLDKHGIALETAHTSGHASEADLGRLVKALQPKTLIPIHTQRPQDYQRLWPHVTRLDDGKEFVIP